MRKPFRLLLHLVALVGATALLVWCVSPGSAASTPYESALSAIDVEPIAIRACPQTVCQADGTCEKINSSITRCKRLSGGTGCTNIDC